MEGIIGQLEHLNDLEANVNSFGQERVIVYFMDELVSVDYG